MASILGETDEKMLAELDSLASSLLTPTPRKTGKRGGGRSTLGDPRMDPEIDPKKARRIFANRCAPLPPSGRPCAPHTSATPAE